VVRVDRRRRQGGLEAAKAQLEHEVMGGQTCWFSTSEPSVTEASPTAHLLSIYDEYISGYKDRSAMVDEAHAARLWALGNALRFIVVVDGQVPGTWRRMLSRDAVVVETDIFRRLTEAEERAVGLAAQRYGVFLGLPVVQ
jgi:hypothetical protein